MCAYAWRRAKGEEDCRGEFSYKLSETESFLMKAQFYLNLGERY